MTEKKRIIYINNKPIKVSIKIYDAYWKEVEKEKYQDKLYRRNVLSLDMIFGEQEFNPLELKYLMEKYNIKNNNDFIKKYEKLVRALFELKADEIELIISLYFDDMNQTEFSKISGISQQAVSKKHKKVINKLRKLINL